MNQLLAQFMSFRNIPDAAKGNKNPRSSWSVKHPKHASVVVLTLEEARRLIESPLETVEKMHVEFLRLMNVLANTF